VAAQAESQRVLVVDDDDAISTLMRRALMGEGYHVDLAASVTQARTMSPGGYDAVLVDARIGSERGTDLIDALLAEDPAAASRCLMVTGGDTLSLPAGVAFLAKPFRPAELVSAVRALGGHDPACGEADPVRGEADPGRTIPSGPAGGPPPEQGLLRLLRRMRSGERTALADFVHDGPVQDLTAATLTLRMISWPAQPDLEQTIAEVQRQLDAAARGLRWITDEWPFPGPESGLADTLRRRAAWFLPPSVTIEVQRSAGAPRPGPLDAALPIIADVAELALFVLADQGWPGPAHVSVQDRGQVIEIGLTLAADAGDGGAAPADPAAVQAVLEEVARPLGGTAGAEAAPGGRRAWLRLPVSPGTAPAR
jgi:two-component system response regulator RegX3